jgi:DNA replication and repair protein RecF
MRLTRVDVEATRIVARARLDPASRVNVIAGGNAAGKTSLLEAIHVLATGRSFAAGSLRAVVQRGGGPLRVVGRLVDAAGRSRIAGFERAATGRPRMRLDGGDVGRIVDVARLLPVVAVHPGSHDLVAGGPGERRTYLDRGLFHVEPTFQGTWQGYRRCLAQRNAMLRAGQPAQSLAAWEAELARYGAALDAARCAYVADLRPRAERIGGCLLGQEVGLRLGYKPGWEADAVSLQDALAGARERDRDQSRTTVGPHRADLELWVGQGRARQQVSRGQQKLVAYALRLAQAEQLAERAGGLVLLDDLPAELDRDRCGRVVAEALAVGAQLFVTALEPSAIRLPAEAEVKRFHVGQGQVHELVQ